MRASRRVFFPWCLKPKTYPRVVVFHYCRIWSSRAWGEEVFVLARAALIEIIRRTNRSPPTRVNGYGLVLGDRGEDSV